jgi:hypothetical protein
MNRVSRDLSLATEAYAAYLNAPRGLLDTEEQMLFDEDLARARAAMERAWLESTPVQAPAGELRTQGAGPIPAAWAAIKHAARKTLGRR